MKSSTFGNLTLPISHHFPEHLVSSLYQDATAAVSNAALFPPIFHLSESIFGKESDTSYLYLVRNSFFLTVERKIAFLQKSFEHLGAIGRGKQRTLPGISEMLSGRSAPGKSPLSGLRGP